MIKHDEDKDIKSLSKIAKIDTVNKTIQIAKTQLIGNKRWGRLDYLTHYCGYTLIWSTAGQIAALKAKSSDSETIVKEKKEVHKLSNKNSKTSKKK